MESNIKKAFILSAGTGERLKPFSNGIPKALLKINGVEVLLTNIKNLREFSIEEFIIVINPKHKSKIKAFLKEYNIDLKVVINEFPERENGYSAFLLKDYIKENENFVIIMGDHLYEKKFVEEAIKKRGLIVDEIGKYIDKKEATKVYYENGRIIKIGKKLKKFNAFDTGFIITDRKFIDCAIELEKKREKIKISEIIKRAKLEISKVSGYFWIDLDTLKDIERAKMFFQRTEQ
ncbi:MAG: sugar phosphate nucleotidyltransferase [Candidatus Hydrothermales bacterium]